LLGRRDKVNLALQIIGGNIYVGAFNATQGLQIGGTFKQFLAKIATLRGMAKIGTK